MSQQQPQFYNQLTTLLGPEEQQVIKQVFEKADQIQLEAQKAAGEADGVAIANGSS
jgi:hypothetical protein